MAADTCLWWKSGRYPFVCYGVGDCIVPVFNSLTPVVSNGRKKRNPFGIRESQSMPAEYTQGHRDQIKFIVLFVVFVGGMYVTNDKGICWHWI